MPGNMRATFENRYTRSRMGLQRSPQDNSDFELATNPQRRAGRAFDNNLASAADPILIGGLVPGPRQSKTRTKSVHPLMLTFGMPAAKAANNHPRMSESWSDAVPLQTPAFSQQRKALRGALLPRFSDQRPEICFENLCWLP